MLLLSSFVATAHAANQGFDLISKVGCAQSGNCTISDIIDGFGVLMNWGVSISGAIALLMFIIGGVYMLASAGRADWVKTGKSILVGTSIALFFIFSSWLIVNFVVNSLVQDDRFKLQPGLQGTTYGPDQSDYNLFCQRPNSEGLACGGPNMLCHDSQCVTRCELNHQNDPQDWGCNPASYCRIPVGFTCEDKITTACEPAKNLCPPKEFYNSKATEEVFCCYQPLQ